MTRKVRRFIFQLMPITLLCGFALGLLTMKAVQPGAAKTWANVVFDGQLMSGEPPLPVASLRDIVGAAATHDQATAAVADYYTAYADQLATTFNEANDARLRGLFGMYIVHQAQPYNVAPPDWETYTLLDFLNAKAAHCGLYALAQSYIYTALGLRWQNIIVDGGWHGLLQADIDGQWETFDSTSNVWLSVGVPELISGAARRYRAFYTPVWDASADEVYRQHYTESGGYYSVPDLRAGLPVWGLRMFPSRWEISAAS